MSKYDKPKNQAIKKHGWLEIKRGRHHFFKKIGRFKLA